MFDAASGASSQFDKGQMVFDAKTQQSGIIVSGEYFEFSGQFVYRVHVAGMACLQSWGESRLRLSMAITALTVGNMIIAFDHQGQRHMGQVTGKTVDGRLMARFADGEFKVDMSRVWRAWPAPSVMAVAS
jgi:hypothetical protein